MGQWVDLLRRMDAGGPVWDPGRGRKPIGKKAMTDAGGNAADANGSGTQARPNGVRSAERERAMAEATRKASADLGRSASA
jgi:hypothetical protein